MIEVQAPNGAVIEFPDGTPASVIDAEMNRIYSHGLEAHPMSWGDALAEGAKNLPGSAKGVLKDTFEAFSHPVETAKALGKIAGGYAAKLIPGRQAWEDNADAMTDYFSQRYGSADAVKQTLAKDPAGLLGDLSSVFTGGAGAVRGLAKGASLAGKAGLAAGLGRGASGLGAAAAWTDPLSLVTKGGDFAARKGLGLNLPEKVYQSALGINTGFSNNGKARYAPREVRDMVRAGLENRIPVTHAGWSEAGAKISDLNRQIDEAIDAADAAGIAVDNTRIFEDAVNSPAREQISRMNTPEADLNAFDGAIEEWWRNHGADSTVRGAQESKKATYQQHEKRYQNNAAPVAHGKTEGAMEIARQQRRAISDAVQQAVDQGVISPLQGGNIHDLNRREGTLIDLRDNIERSVLKSGNRSNIDWLTGSIGAMATGDPATGIGLGAAKQVLTSPGLRSRTAFLLDKARKTGNPWRPMLAPAYLGIQEGRRDPAFQQGVKRRTVDELAGLLSLMGGQPAPQPALVERGNGGLLGHMMQRAGR